MATSDLAVSAEGLRKRFGRTDALRGIDLAIRPGIIFGLLGPNGSGKTTTVRILSTLIRPDGGAARVAGIDVVKDAANARFKLGLAGQYAAVDEVLSGRANLHLFGRLYHLPGKTVRARADELLEGFGLADVASNAVKTYSGGMRRRLDLATSLLVAPPVLFLDEPTTGLDPRNRLMMWDLISDLVHQGTTVLLTTQYLEEADRLAHDIVVIDKGQVVAKGTASQLQAGVGSAPVDVALADRARIPDAVEALRRATGAEPEVLEAEGRIVCPAPGGPASLIAALRELDDANVEIVDIDLRRPTLDEAFLQLTGGALSTAAPADTDAEVAS